MRRFIILFLGILMLLMLFGCSGQSVGNEDSQESVTTDTQGKSGEENDSQGTDLLYDESTVMFLAWDDSKEFYRYNYKGDCLEIQGSSPYTGIYSTSGLLPARDPVSGKYGYVDNDGVFVISPKYDRASVFASNGLAVVAIYDKDYDYSCGIIDTSGQEIISCSYYYLSSYFPSGYAIFCVEDTTGEGKHLYGILDSTGKVVVDAVYANISYVYDGYFCGLKDDYSAATMYSSQVGRIYSFSGEELDRLERIDTENGYYIPRYTTKNGKLYKTYSHMVAQQWDGVSADNVVTWEIFNGNCFQAIDIPCEISYKRVATTYSGIGYGATADGKTVIPFKYDRLVPIGSYFVGIVCNDPCAIKMIIYVHIFLCYIAKNSPSNHESITSSSV